MSQLEADAPQKLEPSIYSLHPLCHPFMSAIGLVVMVTVPSASLSRDCDLCCQEENDNAYKHKSRLTQTYTFINCNGCAHWDFHSYTSWALNAHTERKGQSVSLFLSHSDMVMVMITQGCSDRKSAPLIIQSVCAL